MKASKKLQESGLPYYDLICIGSGSAGGAAAISMAAKGWKVALIEKNIAGGQCLNDSCIPANAFLGTAKLISMIQAGQEIGLNIERINYSWQKILAFKEKAVRRGGGQKNFSRFENLGIDIYKGEGKFSDAHTIDINGQQITGRKFIIASGTKPFIPDIKGLKGNFITYKEVFNLPRPPESIFIIGGEATACLLAFIFSSLGSSVYLATRSSRLLEREDEEVGQTEAEILKSKGVEIYLDQPLDEIQNNQSDDYKVIFRHQAVVKNIEVQKIVLASGQIPNLDLNLKSAEISFQASALDLNQYLQTSQPHIYAGGDVVGHDMSATFANYHAQIICHNLEKPKRKLAYDYRALPRCLAGEPEIATCGFTEKELQNNQVAYLKSLVPLKKIARSHLSNQDEGFVKLLCSPDGHILGASIIAPSASEIIAQITLAIRNEITVFKLKENTAAFPTFSIAINLACSRLIKK